MTQDRRPRTAVPLPPPVPPTTMPVAGPARRGFLLGGLAAPLAAPGIARAQSRRLALVTTWPRGLPGLWDGAARFADRVTATSGGTLEIEVFAAGERMGAFDVFDAVSAGDADMYHGAEYYWQSRTKAFNFFTTVPFGLTSAEFTTWMQVGGGQALWDELLGGYNLKGFMCGNTGVQMGGWYSRQIESLDDMMGLRIRIPGLAGDIFRALGSEPVSLPGGAIADALFAGQIDAVEWVGPFNDLHFGIQKVLRHYMYPGFHEPGTSLSLGVNAGVWSGLSTAHQTIIATAAAAENREMAAQYAARSGRALDLLTREYGTVVSRFPDKIYTEVARISTGILGDIAASDSYAARVVESFFAFRAQVGPWSRAMTGTYVSQRANALVAANSDAFSDADVAD